MSLAAGLAGHGGRLCVARALYPRAPEPWIDLSTGINPEAYPAPYASAAARGRLPTPEEIRALEVTAGRAFGVDSADRIAAAAGSEAALRLMPYALEGRAPAESRPMPYALRGQAAAESRPMSYAWPAEEAVVVGPTYSSHAATWQQAGAHVHFANGIASDMSDSLDVAVRFAESMPPRSAITLVNPNNPDGALISREHLLRLHDVIASRDDHLVVDEAFADAEPVCSVAAFAGTARYPQLIVLRSFGKFYGLAGVRLGFVIGASPVIARFRELLGDWPVSADAIAAGLAAYADDPWATHTRERLLHAARRLDDVLIRSGFAIVGGTSLFRLARHDDARNRFENLLRAGVLARPFDHDPTLLRFGLPHEPSAWQRLADALRTP